MFRAVVALTIVLAVYAARAEEKQPPAKSGAVSVERTFRRQLHVGG